MAYRSPVGPVSVDSRAMVDRYILSTFNQRTSTDTSQIFHWHIVATWSTHLEEEHQLSLSQSTPCWNFNRKSRFVAHIRDFKIQRRGRHRERQKNNRFYKKNNQFARISRFFVHFFARFCTTTTWKCLIWRFMEYVNKQRRNFISLSELGYGFWEFHSRRVCLHLTK